MSLCFKGFVCDKFIFVWVGFIYDLLSSVDFLNLILKRFVYFLYKYVFKFVKEFDMWRCCLLGIVVKFLLVVGWRVILVSF